MTIIIVLTISIIEYVYQSKDYGFSCYLVTQSQINKDMQVYKPQNLVEKISQSKQKIRFFLNKNIS